MHEDSFEAAEEPAPELLEQLAGPTAYEEVFASVLGSFAAENVYLDASAATAPVAEFIPEPEPNPTPNLAAAENRPPFWQVFPPEVLLTWQEAEMRRRLAAAGVSFSTWLAQLTDPFYEVTGPFHAPEPGPDAGLQNAPLTAAAAEEYPPSISDSEVVAKASAKLKIADNEFVRLGDRIRYQQLSQLRNEPLPEPKAIAQAQQRGYHRTIADLIALGVQNPYVALRLLGNLRFVPTLAASFVSQLSVPDWLHLGLGPLFPPATTTHSANSAQEVAAHLASLFIHQPELVLQKISSASLLLIYQAETALEELNRGLAAPAHPQQAFTTPKAPAHPQQTQIVPLTWRSATLPSGSHLWRLSDDLNFKPQQLSLQLAVLPISAAATSFWDDATNLQAPFQLHLAPGLAARVLHGSTLMTHADLTLVPQAASDLWFTAADNLAQHFYATAKLEPVRTAGSLTQQALKITLPDRDAAGLLAHPTAALLVRRQAQLRLDAEHLWFFTSDRHTLTVIATNSPDLPGLLSWHYLRAVTQPAAWCAALPLVVNDHGKVSLVQLAQTDFFV